MSTQTQAAAPDAGEPTAIVADDKATALAGLAWSAAEDYPDDDDTELWTDERGRTTVWLWFFVAVLAVIIAVLGLTLWDVLGTSAEDTAAPATSTPAAAPSPDDTVVPSTTVEPAPAPPPIAAPPPEPTSTVTVTETPTLAAPPPVQTVAPPRPSSAALDEQFLADLTSAGITITDVAAAIYGGHDTCAYLAAGHTAAEAEETGMRNNASMTHANAIAVVDAAIAVYCPQYQGVQ